VAQIPRGGVARTSADSGLGLTQLFGGPGRDRTDDLFHAMEARSQLRHRPTLEKDGADYGAIDILSHVNSGVKRASL
jgi:hypothetical protein